MKTVLVLASLCLVSLALVPPAQADTAPSRDGLVGCQRDFSGGRAIAVPIGVGVLCVDPTETWCTAWIEWTAIPQTPTCLVAPIHAAASIGPESTPDLQCMDVYSQTELVGGYWLVRRDSCSAQVYWCPEGHQPPAPPCAEAQLFTTSAAALPAVEAPPVYCMPYERHLEVVPGLTIVQGGCGSYILLCGDRVTATTDPATLDVSCLDDSIVTTTAEPQCLDYYRETEVGPIRHVQRDSCHSETYVCDDNVKQVADPTQPQPDEATLQRCLRDTLDDYISWT